MKTPRPSQPPPESVSTGWKFSTRAVKWKQGRAACAAYPTSTASSATVNLVAPARKEGFEASLQAVRARTQSDKSENDSRWSPLTLRGTTDGEGSNLVICASSRLSCAIVLPSATPGVAGVARHIRMVLSCEPLANSRSAASVRLLFQILINETRGACAGQGTKHACADPSGALRTTPLDISPGRAHTGLTLAMTVDLNRLKAHGTNPVLVTNERKAFLQHCMAQPNARGTSGELLAYHQ